jgi:uncharacterized protein
MKNKLFFVVLTILIVNSVNAQLHRRAFLGTRLWSVNDSIARIYELPAVKGALIDLVVENSSAEAIGLQPGDVIVSVMGKEMQDQSSVTNTIASYREGDVVNVKFFRNGRLLEADAALKGFPLETSEYAEVIYDAVPFDGGYIRTIIRRPSKEGRFPALFFIQGANCGSIEMMNSRSPQAQLMEGFAQKGYVVIKTEKAGVGDSQNNKDCSQYNLMEEVDLFAASFNHLEKYDFIDMDNVFIFGHSMGGVQAPLMKTNFPPKGIAVFGTIARPWFEYFVEIARKQRLMMGQDYLENEIHHEKALRFYYSLMVEKKTPAEMMEDEDLKEFMFSQWRFDGEEKFLGRHYTFWQQLQDTRMFTAWANTPAYVLSIWGEGEYVAFNPYEHELIADIVNHYNPGKATYIRMPNIDHGFLWVKDRIHAIEIRNDLEYFYNNFNHEIVEVVHQWMEEIINSEKSDL